MLKKPSTCVWKDSLKIEFGSMTPSLPDLAETGSNLLANRKQDRLAKFSNVASVMRREFDAARTSRTSETAWARIDHRLRAGLDRL